MVTALRGPLLVFFLPAAVLAPLARNTAVRTIFGTLLQPRVAFSLWAANLAIWHIPYLYDAALHHQNLHDFEHVCWVFCGLLVWTLLVDPGSHKRLTVGGRVALAASMFAAGMILSDVLIFTLHAALSLLPRRLRDLGGHRPAARGDRDDGRAALHPRDLRRPDPAAALEPHARGAARRSHVSATAFSFEPLFLVLAAAAAVFYWRAARRDRPETWRVVSFASGVFLIAASLNSPLETVASHFLLLMHLLQNALIADLAPLLVLLGLTPGMRAALGRRGLDRVRARWILPIWLGAWYLTHLAPFYNWALRTGWGLNIEHAILIAVGLLFWWPIVSGRLSVPAGLAYLAVAFIGSSFLGLAYIFSSRPFYSYYEHAPRLWGLSPIRDQNLGGILMNGEQTLVFLLAIGWFVMRLLDEEHAREEVAATPREPLSDT